MRSRLSPAVILCGAVLGLVRYSNSEEITACAFSGREDVTIITRENAYCRTESIPIAIRNQSSNPIFVTSGQTFCTIVSLERRENASWQMVGRCPAGAPPGILTIAAGEERVISLGPNSHFYVPLVPGRYRLALAFAGGADGQNHRVIYSHEFDISDC
jgi:hypothetical protein